MARPLKNINWDTVERRMEAGCSAKEIAGGLLIDINTFYERFKKEFGMGFSDFADSFKSSGVANIRFRQYMKAMEGNVEMLKLLGREWLGQGKEELEKPTNDLFNDISHENMILRAKLAKIESPDADKPKTRSKLCRSSKKV